jgi:glycosyltransferase involved in cell wall biosynthesis
VRVLMVHAFYQQRAGEDRSFVAEAELLTSRGVEVELFTFDNAEIEAWSAVRKATSLVWNAEMRRKMAARIAAFRPDVLHVQNLFPGVSPSVYAAAQEAGVPVVQKLSNFRLFCANGMLFRDGKVCESCMGKALGWRAVVHGCYRGDRVMSGAIASATALHRALGTWSNGIQAYVALDADGRDRFVQAGLPAEKLYVKPNFLDPFPSPGEGQGGFALFAGRFADGKGVETLVRAWKGADDLPPLTLAGDGPLMGRVREIAGESSNIEFLGRVAPADLDHLMGQAACVVVPSEFHEPFGRVALEAMGCGTPVLSTTSGALKHVVRPGVSGAHFRPGDVDGLTTAVRSLFSDPGALAALRISTREDAMTRFSGDANFRILMDIYQRVGAHINRPQSALDAA